MFSNPRPNVHLEHDMITSALIKVFRPLVRYLLRINVPYRTCADALKWTYVDLATHEFAIGNQKQTKSRVAVITGITRIEVERLNREGVRGASETSQRYNRAGKVLSAWENDPKYLTNDHKPRVLPLTSDHGPSFESLVIDHAGGTTTNSILDEVLANGNVVLDPETQSYSLISANVLVTEPEAQLDVWATAAGDLLGTIERNLRPNQTDRRFQAFAHEMNLEAIQIDEVRAFVKEKGNEFLEEFDRFLGKLSQERKDPNAPTIPRVGMGLYYFQDDPEKADVVMDSRGRKRN